MVERVTLTVESGAEALQGAVARYDLLKRLARSARKQGVVLLAFGLGQREHRLVLEGAPSSITNLLRGLRVGTVRAMRRWAEVRFGDTHREQVHTELEVAVAWAHAITVEDGATSPLASPWSSHRDLLFFRRAPFYDADAVVSRLDPRRVHALAGGRTLPLGWPPRDPIARESLSRLLRVAGAIVGVLPADRRCFRLFSHLGLHRGWSTQDLANALALTPRRIRQLASDAEPLLDVALVSLADPRLCRVP